MFGDKSGVPLCEEEEGEEEEAEDEEAEEGVEGVEGVDGVEGVLLAGAEVSGISGIPFVKYSTALSGLLNAALRALTTSSLGNPISHKLATMPSYSEPVTNVDAASVGFDLNYNKHSLLV